MKFIYVCSEEDRDRLMSLGFRFIKNQKGGSLWAFENDETLGINLDAELDVYVFSNTLTF